MTDCNYCGTAIPLSFYAKLRKDRDGVNVAVRCPRCGTPHVDGEAIQPQVLPLQPGLQYRYSPWQLHMYRPVREGFYECRFREIEPQVTLLYWNGARFVYRGELVSMRGFLGWRGQWL